MLWLLVAASLVGFLAVGALTQVVGQSTALPTLPTPWLWLSGSCLGGLVAVSYTHLTLPTKRIV